MFLALGWLAILLRDGLQAGLAGDIGFEPGRFPLIAVALATAHTAGRKVLTVVAVVVVVDMNSPVDLHCLDS